MRIAQSLMCATEKKWSIKPQPTANSWTLFSSVSNHKALYNAVHSYLQLLKQNGKDNNFFSNPKIPTNILMTFSMQKKTFSCFSLNHDILALLKGHFNWHSWVQGRDLFSCKTLQRLDYSFTSVFFCWRLDHQPAMLSSQLFLSQAFSAVAMTVWCMDELEVILCW